jgi:hypothetical protein
MPYETRTLQPDPCNPILATWRLQNGLQNAGAAKALTIKPRLMPINVYVAGRARKACGIDTRGAGGGGFSPRRACRSREHANSTRRRRRQATDQARAGLIKRMPAANGTKGHAK